MFSSSPLPRHFDPVNNSQLLGSVPQSYERALYCSFGHVRVVFQRHMPPAFVVHYTPADSSLAAHVPSARLGSSRLGVSSCK